MSDFEIRFQEAKRQYTDHNYREAYDILDELVKLPNIDPTLIQEAQNLYKIIPRESGQACHKFQKKINKIQSVDDYLHVNKQELQDDLDAWRNAILAQDMINKTLYDNAQKHLQNLENQYQQVLEAEPIERQVKAEWDRARQLRIDNPAISPNFILGIYTEAERLAREAASINPDNNHLKVLLDTARSHRERLSGEEEAMTSGGLMGEYQKTLDHIERTPIDGLVPVYDMQGIFMRNMPRDEARKIVEEFARSHAKAKANEYSGQAEVYLSNFDPRNALAALAQREKIENFLTPNDRERLNTLMQEIQTEIRQLEQAEEIVQHALEQIGNAGALATWREYQEGIARYEGAEDSPRIKNARAQIVKVANQEIRDLSTQIESLFNQNKLPQATSLIETSVSNYRAMKLASLVEIEQWQQRINYRQQQEQRIQNRLQDILRSVAGGNTEDASQLLKAVETEFLSTGIIEANTSLKDLYSQTKNEVQARSDAEGQIRFLSQALEATTEASVQDAIRHIERAIQLNPAFENQFRELRLQLELHLEYLRIRNLAAQQQLEEAVTRLEAIIHHPMITGDYKGQLEDTLSTLKADYAAQSNNDQLLKEARTLLQSDPQRAFVILENFRARTAHENRQRVELQNEARSNWLSLIEQHIRRFELEAPPEIELIAEYETNLRDLDDHIYQRYSTRLLMYRLVSQAYVAEQSGVLNEAVRLLKQASERATGSDQFKITEMIRAIERSLVEREKDQLLEDTANQAKDPDHLLEQLLSMQDRLSQLATETQDSTYSIWQLEVMLTQGQYQKNATTSRQIFVNCNLLAGRINQEVRNTKQLTDDLRQLIKIAEYSPKIGEARLNVEKYLKAKSELGRFIETIDGWRNTFTDEYSRYMPHLAYWYSDLANGVEDELRHQISGKNIEVDNLEAYARLVILTPQGDFAEDMINRLPFLQKDLEEETERLIRDIVNSRDYQLSHGGDILVAQIRTFEQHLRKLNTINQILNRFRRQLGGEADNLVHSTTLKIEDTSRAIIILKSLKDLTDRFELYMDGLHDLRKTVAAEELNQRYDTFIRDVRNIVAANAQHLKINDLTKHTTVVFLERRKNSFYKTQEELEILLAEVADQIQNEDYSSALQHLREKITQMFEANSDMFKERRRSFQILDPWSKNTIESWDEVKKLIERRRNKMAQLLDWAICFGIFRDYLTDNIITDISDNPLFRVVDWEDFQYQAETLRLKAQFEEARQMVRMVLDKSTNRNFRSLPEALRELQLLPPGITANEIESLRGRRLLLETQAHYDALYNQQISEAEDYIKLLDQQETQFQQWEKDFNDGLQVMTRNQNGGWFSGGDHNAYRRGEETARKALENVRRTCPDYPRLNDMEKRLNSKRRT